MQEIVKFAVCGAGYIGMRHATILANHKDCELVAICDTDLVARENAKKLGIPVYKELDVMVDNHKDIKVLSICTPNNLHGTQALLGVQRGMHVIVEKPMDIDPEICLDLVEEAEKSGVQVFCVMQNRYSPPSQWLKGLLDENRLGEIYLIQVNCYWNRDERYYSKSNWKGKLKEDGGPLFTQFSHFMDLLFWLFGDVELKGASFANFNHAESTEFEDSGIIHFLLGRGALGAFHYSTAVWDKNFESSITILGEKGTIRVGGQYMERVEYCHIDNYEMPDLPASNPPNQYPGYTGSASNHQYIFENVIHTLRGIEKPTIHPMEGYKVVEIIDRIYRMREV